MRFFLVLLLCALSPWLSCISSKKSLKEHKGTYLESVKLNYDAGIEALKKEDYDKAISYFQFVRSKYPFSKYAALSDLRIADAKFAQKKWLDAASAYQVFIRLHPRHEDVAYASYRVGISYFHAVPSDFFLLPPSTSRDQSFTKEALSAIEQFILQFPDSEYLADAIEKRKLLFSYLAQHNEFIAAYYERRGRYQAAVERYLAVDKLYPETEESAHSLFLAGRILEKKLNQPEQAMDIYRKIVQEKPDSKYRKKAQEELERLGSLPQALIEND
ncbi:MAG TPA: outer membrane protein assembly factor BamD [Myxococcota bacterium]|nr:outer membrane protein assembly factor BamD [Myxococcota bacterium]